MQHKQIDTRDAALTDIVAMTELMNQLGYATTEDEMKTRFTHIQQHGDYKTLVATKGTQVVGMVGMAKNFFYEQNGIYVRVLALVTNSDARQHGVGRKLMEAAEKWAMEIGAGGVLLNCGNREERAIAHQFYKKLGYEVKSSGFIKKLY